MKTSKFSDAQKVFILKQGDDSVPDAEICRKAGISQPTCFNWRKQYAGFMPDEIRPQGQGVSWRLSFVFFFEQAKKGTRVLGEQSDETPAHKKIV